MYIDRRAQKTIAALNESFIELLRDKPLGRITVKEVCEKADIYRSTYYRHFSDPHDHAITMLRAILFDAKDCIVSHTEKIDILDGTKKFCRIFYDNKEAYLVLRDNIHANEYSEMVEDVFKWRFLPFLGIKSGYFDSESEEYMFNYTMNAAQSIIANWLRNDSERITPEKMAEFLHKTVFSILTVDERVA